jgi:hypothetical protein
VQEWGYEVDCEVVHGLVLDEAATYLYSLP